MRSDIPTPPNPDELAPLIMTWRRSRRLFRVHSSRFGATEFNPGMGAGRFHPFKDGNERIVPTIYAADRFEGALSETVFHDVPQDHSQPRRIFREALKTLMLSVLVSSRVLKLIDLRGYGLAALRLTHDQFLNTGAEAYTQTVAWAQALHRAGCRADGMVWMSRLFDRAEAVMLFGDRVDRGQLGVVSPPVPLYSGPGFALVDRAARLSRVQIIEGWD